MTRDVAIALSERLADAGFEHVIEAPARISPEVEVANPDTPGKNVTIPANYGDGYLLKIQQSTFTSAQLAALFSVITQSEVAARWESGAAIFS